MFWKNGCMNKKAFWNNCTLAYISLKLHNLTDWFIILCINIALAYYYLSSFYAFYHFPREGVGCWFWALNTTLNKLILQIGCPSNQKVFIQKPLSQLAEESAWNSWKYKKIFSYECFSIANCIAYLYCT